MHTYIYTHFFFSELYPWVSKMSNSFQITLLSKRVFLKTLKNTEWKKATKKKDKMTNANGCEIT